MNNSTMATKMNSKTHKVIVATYCVPETIYAVPIDWNVDEITIKYGTVYYKGEEVELESVEMTGDSKYPSTIEDTDDYELEDYFDCEEDENECCDGGCGKKMGESRRIYCDDCDERCRKKIEDECICGKAHKACFNCVMCAEPIYQSNFSQNCGLCMKSMCMNCDNERKLNGENVCEKCEENVLEE